jgi:ATP-dependent DNA helicase RecQ
VSASFSTNLAADAARVLKHAELDLDCRKRVPAGAFPRYGFHGNLAAGLRAERGRILCRWQDAGWGQAVAADKHANHFRDELVEAVAEMIQDRWRLETPPGWVTCVPSHNHPELVPGFARRLAARLGLPFLAAVSKVQVSGMQKLQQNSYHQCRNLDGVFEVTPEIPCEPVLLVDDLVDSRWTLTVVAALLRQAGSGPVLPLALATTSAGD